MTVIDHSYRIMYSELAQRALDAQFAAEFSLKGRFVTQAVGNRRYWYFDTDRDGGKTRQYVGPVDDQDITSRVEAFKDLKADHRARRKLVSTLVREAHLPRPEAFSGDVIQALAQAGFFRLRGVLVGTAAFGVYPAMLGVRLPSSAMQTGDADFAQFHAISVAVEDSIPPILDVLRGVDPTFREIPHSTDGRETTQFKARSGFMVDFLTPNTGSADHDGKPARMPALGGSAAQPLRFLDFLIREPLRAVLLHGAGVPVLAPSPERFAVHKLIVAARRRTDRDGTEKADKDRLQALLLMETLVELRRTDDLADVWMEAWERGGAWQDALRASIRTLDPRRWADVRSQLEKAVKRLNALPAEYGLLDEDA